MIFGLSLRAANPTFGSPSLYVSNDEAIAHLSAWNMLAAKTPVSIANYTPLGAYIQLPFLAASYLTMKALGLVHNATGFEVFVLTREGYFLFIPRLISAFFGSLLIILVYKITLLMFNQKRAALISAFMTAVSFNLVHISNTGRPWSAALFFIVLSFYLALKGNRLFPYLVLGVAYGFHQAAFLALPLIILAGRGKIRWKIAGAVMFLLFFLIFNNLTLKTGLVQAIANNQSFLKKGKFLADFITGEKDLFGSPIGTFQNNLSFYFLKNIFVTDGGILGFGILGIFLCRKVFFIRSVITYLILYFVFASLFFHPLIRYLLIPLILLIPFSAIGIAKLITNKFLLAIILVLISINSLWWVNLYIKKPTFLMAQEWVKINIDKDVPVAYTGGRFSIFVPNREAISYMQKVTPNLWQKLYGLNLENSENVRNIIYSGKFPGSEKIVQFENATLNYPVKYVLDYYLDPRESINVKNSDRFILVKHFSPASFKGQGRIAETLFDPSSNFGTYDRKGSGSMYSLERTGPIFDILMVKNYSGLTNKK